MNFMRVAQSAFFSFFVFSSFFIFGSDVEQTKWVVQCVAEGDLNKPCFGGNMDFDATQMILTFKKQYATQGENLIYNEVNNIPAIRIPLSQVPYLYQTMPKEKNSSVLSINVKGYPHEGLDENTWNEVYFSVENKENLQLLLEQQKNRRIERKIFLTNHSISNNSSSEEIRDKKFKLARIKLNIFYSYCGNGFFPYDSKPLDTDLFGELVFIEAKKEWVIVLKNNQTDIYVHNIIALGQNSPICNDLFRYLKKEEQEDAHLDLLCTSGPVLCCNTYDINTKLPVRVILKVTPEQCKQLLKDNTNVEQEVDRSDEKPEEGEGIDFSEDNEEKIDEEATKIKTISFFDITILDSPDGVDVDSDAVVIDGNLIFDKTRKLWFIKGDNNETYSIDNANSI